MINKIRIEILGKSNDQISNAVLKIINEENVDDLVKNFICTNKNAIIEKFLKKMDKKGVVNAAIGASKKNNTYSLWTPEYYGSSYFGNVVGVMEDELSIDKNEEIFQADLLELTEHLDFEVRLQIKTKFDTEKPYFLTTMLLSNKIKLNDNMVLSSEDDLFDYILLFWYKTKLLEAYEKGFYKTYRRFEANGEKLKGAIDIARHIRLNVGQNNGKIAFSYRENTINNYLNHLIVMAYQYMKKKYPELVEENIDNDSDLKAIIEVLKCEIGYDSLNSKDLIKENNKPISHPYFMEYEDLRRICIKILRDEGISIWDAEEEKTKSILFYIPDLWELYLEDKIRERGEIGPDLYTQGKTPDGDQAIRIFGDLSAKKNRDFTKATYPDFIFFDEKDPYLILDAKFKTGWSSSLDIKEGSSRISNLDDYDKCIRDMNSVNANATGIIYPTNEIPSGESDYFDEESISHRISVYNQKAMFYTFPILVPDAYKESRYTEWKKLFDRYVDVALDKIAEKVLEEKKYAGLMREYMKNAPSR